LFTAAAAVFIEVAKKRTLRDIKLAADAMPYIVSNWVCDSCALTLSLNYMFELVQKAILNTAKNNSGAFLNLFKELCAFHLLRKILRQV
jgi:hypothetical protein